MSVGSPIDQILGRLDAAKRVGDGYVARCPAHEDKSPSLRVKEGDDGRVLLHDFGGCTALDVVQALGLTLADLYPRRVKGAGLTRAGRSQGDWAAALGVLSREATIVSIAAREIIEGRSLDEHDCGRLALAIGRIDSARMVLR